MFNEVIQSCIDVTWLLVKEIEGVFQGNKFNDSKKIHEMILLLGMETRPKYYYFSYLVRKRDGAC